MLINVGPRKCTATMTIPQMLLLMCFNAADDISIGYLVDTLGLNIDAVCSCLKALVDFKLLKTEPMVSN